MSNCFFSFKQFTVQQEHCAMKVTTDACLFGAWVATELASGNSKPERCLDIGSGTGLLSLMMAQKNAIVIDSVEIDEAAAREAEENIFRSPWSNRIRVIHSNIKEWNAAERYDCIISNPPFYESELKSGKTKKDIAHHDEGLKWGFIQLY